ncbi:hypothetical protein pb186bvf_020264 [Paramecium bursaria]
MILNLIQKSYFLITMFLMVQHNFLCMMLHNANKYLHNLYKIQHQTIHYIIVPTTFINFSIKQVYLPLPYSQL